MEEVETDQTIGRSRGAPGRRGSTREKGKGTPLFPAPLACLPDSGTAFKPFKSKSLALCRFPSFFSSMAQPCQAALKGGMGVRARPLALSEGQDQGHKGAGQEGVWRGAGR